MAKKKPTKNTRLAKEARRRKRQGDSGSAARRPAGELNGPTMGLTMPGAAEPWGFVQFAPAMTVVEFIRRTEAGETITGEDVDLTDPPLGVELSRRAAEWVDDGEPRNSLWGLTGSAGDGEYAEPLSISVGIDNGRPRWGVTYPSPDDMARPFDEVFTTRDELLAALDRLETQAST